MKNLFRTLVIVFALTSLTSAKADNPGDNIFRGTQIHTINIQFFVTNYWDSLTFYYNAGGEQYMPVTATVNGVVLDNSIGVRFKGNSSYSHPNNKKPFKLSFDEYNDDQRWDGLKKVVLNNCYLDPTFMREKIHLDFCRDAGIIAPRANFARLYINGVFWGFYSLVEQVDKTFLSDRYGDNDGNLFKAVDAFGSSIVSDLKWYGSTPSSYYNRYELKTNEAVNDWTDLVTFLDTLNNNTNTLRALPTKVNLNNFYKALAADILFANLDAYVNSGRNFYIYDLPTTGLFEWIVWDAGLSFGAYPGGSGTAETISLTYVGSTVNRPLIAKVYSTPEFKSAYLTSLCFIYKGYFSSARLFPKIDTIANLIRSHVYEDPRKQYTNANFETNIVSDIGTGSSRKPGLKSFITAREANVQSQLTNLGVNCEVSVSQGDVVINEFMAQNDLIPDPAGEFDDWIELYNNTSSTINLSGMYLSDNMSIPTKWQFPANTTIAPNGYVIVWADEDSGQVGLHANFKLSAGGEQIRLSNIDANYLDSITFGTQTTNRSMARIPNGTGFFTEGAPTFNATNNPTSVEGPGVNIIPTEFSLQQNYPNPFNPSTSIQFQLPVSGFVTLKVFNVLGNEVAAVLNENKTAGIYSIEFNAVNLTSGIYYYKLSVSNDLKDFTAVKRMVLLK